MLFALLRGFRRSTEANPFVIDIPDRTGIWLVARLLALHLLRNVKKCEIYFRISIRNSTLTVFYGDRRTSLAAHSCLVTSI